MPQLFHRKYAAIDIGSNAIRLLIINVFEQGEIVSYKKVSLIRVPLRLGNDVFLNGEISEAKVVDFERVMQSFLLLIQVHKVDDYRACATSAMRDAHNGMLIIERVRQSLGMEIKILSGSEEAAIIHSTHIEQRFHDDKSYLYIDVGGGSTELSMFKNGELLASQSFNIGTIRLLLKMDLQQEWTALRSWIIEQTSQTNNLVVIGSGGNINKIYKLFERKDWKPLYYKEVKELHDKLSPLSVEERILHFKLHPDRADVIVPAAYIFTRIMKWGNIVEIQVPKMGLADGLIKSMHARLDFSLLEN